MEKNQLTIHERLILVQNQLKAPKSKYNSFGKYNYRSCEDILEAVKPLLQDAGLLMTLEDEITYIGDNLFVKATASVTDGKNVIRTTAFAGHSLEKKGMDFSQVTGTASSYARKYCLNGLFLIDDTKDADTDEYHKQTSQAPQAPEKKQEESKPNLHPQEGAIYLHLESAASMEDLNKILEDFKITKEELKNYPKLREAFNETAKSFKK